MSRIMGERIMLREYRKEDLEEIRRWVNDPDIVDYLDDVFLYPHTLNETEKYINGVLERERDNEIHFIIAQRETEEYIGQIGLIQIDMKNRVAELGIIVGKKDLQNVGIGTEAIKLLQEFAFQRLNLNKIELRVNAYNRRAFRTYIKCGFVEEGRLRERHYIHGKYEDLIIMGILKREYEDGKGE